MPLVARLLSISRYVKARIRNWTWLSVRDEKDVEQSIIVIVEKRNSTGHGFDQVFLWGGRIM